MDFILICGFNVFVGIDSMSVLVVLLLVVIILWYLGIFLSKCCILVGVIICKNLFEVLFFWWIIL